MKYFEGLLKGAIFGYTLGASVVPLIYAANPKPAFALAGICFGFCAIACTILYLAIRKDD